MLEWDSVLGQSASTGDALFAPAVARNKDVILGVLRRLLPPTGSILEVASGSGEHAVHFATTLPDLRWQPSDVDAGALRSVAAHAKASGLPNILPPVSLDVGVWPWPIVRADAVLAINVAHIAPWSATEGLMAGAGWILSDGGLLYLYGPFRVAGGHTASSNAAFDEDLMARNPAWGMRDLEAVSNVAVAHGLSLVEGIPMPANNFSLGWRRAGHASPRRLQESPSRPRAVRITERITSLDLTGAPLPSRRGTTISQPLTPRDRGQR